ncbi:hypothetical protein ABN702_06405 [Bacillus haimaensis]|uniref:hypothetical protein n=1 Tax=Bacillus haimaensis TaxID=3160967 RepID=UPI003AA9DE0F
MKRNILMLVTLLVSCLILFVFFNQGKNDEHPKILAELEESRHSDGTLLFIFSLTNVGKSQVSLEFPTWLEYNFSISNQSSNEIGEINWEHLDLDRNCNEGRILELEPNEEVQYRLRISEIPHGNYEIMFSSASGYGGIHTKEFIIEED